MKSGTSSLHEYLHQHPQIFMSRFKEPQYFAPHKTRGGFLWGQGNPCPEPGIDWYLRLFQDANGAKFAGESSVSYTAMPSHNGCAQRIRDFNPNARLIYIMRDPVERAISHYWHFVASGVEDRPVLQAMQKRNEYIARSNYAMQLAPYFELFGRKQIFALTLEELTASPGPTFRRIFEWLGVESELPIETCQVHNVGRQELWQTRRGLTPVDMALRHWRWKKVETWLPSGASQAIQSLARRQVQRDAIETRPVIEYLRPILQEHTAVLERVLRRQFSEWKTLYKSSESRVGDADASSKANSAVGSNDSTSTSLTIDRVR